MKTWAWYHSKERTSGVDIVKPGRCYWNTILNNYELYILLYITLYMYSLLCDDVRHCVATTAVSCACWYHVDSILVILQFCVAIASHMAKE